MNSEVEAMYRYANDGEGVPRPSTATFKEFLSFYGFSMWEGQERLFSACERVLGGAALDMAPIVVGPSGHNVGKTWGAGWYGAYLLLKYAETIGATVIVISPNKRITMTQLYGEIKANCELFSEFIEVEITDKFIRIGKSMCVPVAAPRGNNAGNDVQGYHNGVVAAFVDEGANMKKSIIQSLRSCASGGRSVVLILGNPISGSSSSTDNALNYAARRAPDWGYVPLSSAEHPNVITGKEVIKGAISRNYVTDIVHANCIAYKKDESDESDLPVIGSIKKMGRREGVLVKMTYDSSKFKKDQLIIANSEACRRIFGVIMQVTGDGGILPAGYFDRNKMDVSEFYEIMEEYEPENIYLGLDPSGMGGDSGKLAAMFTSQDGKKLYLAIVASMENDRAGMYAEKVLRFVRRCPRSSNVTFSVDSTGGYGSGVCDLIKGIQSGKYKIASNDLEAVEWYGENYKNVNLDLIEFSFSEKCKDKKARKRYRSYTAMIADYMRSTAPTHLRHTYTYGFDEDDVEGCYGRVAESDGRGMILQKKKVHKARHGGKSPDAFDAYLMCVVSLFRAKVTEDKGDQKSGEEIKEFKTNELEVESPIKGWESNPSVPTKRFKKRRRRHNATNKRR